ncbi:hypothetical protein ACOBV9_19835 (plasmid) [Pseudoalteromonas espejiana]
MSASNCLRISIDAPGLSMGTSCPTPKNMGATSLSSQQNTSSVGSSRRRDKRKK